MFFAFNTFFQFFFFFFNKSFKRRRQEDVGNAPPSKRKHIEKSNECCCERRQEDIEISPPSKTPIIKPKSKKIIVIDAGHGGKDPGTIGRYARSKEKNITLSYAKELKKHLGMNENYKVYLTRDHDTFISLTGRVMKARKLKADLFISLHANSINNNKIDTIFFIFFNLFKLFMHNLIL